MVSYASRGNGEDIVRPPCVPIMMLSQVEVTCISIRLASTR